MHCQLIVELAFAKVEEVSCLRDRSGFCCASLSFRFMDFLSFVRMLSTTFLHQIMEYSSSISCYSLKESAFERAFFSLKTSLRSLEREAVGGRHYFDLEGSTRSLLACISVLI